jgi:uncharacterized membrane protein YeiH
MSENLSMGAVWHALDLAGTAVFAISGAAVGVKYRLDVFGVCVLAFVAGNAGGMLRDVMLGATPPAALSGWHHVTVSLVAGLLTVLWHPRLERLRTPILLFDAAGLALFAVSGTEKALAFGLDPLVAAILGMLTGIGGGMLRDLLVNEIPAVLQGQLYAVAALAGAAVVVAGHVLYLPASVPTMIGGAVLCFAIRLASIRRGWSLPTADHIERHLPKRRRADATPPAHVADESGDRKQQGES